MMPTPLQRVLLLALSRDQSLTAVSRATRDRWADRLTGCDLQNSLERMRKARLLVAGGEHLASELKQELKECLRRPSQGRTTLRYAPRLTNFGNAVATLFLLAECVPAKKQSRAMEIVRHLIEVLYTREKTGLPLKPQPGLDVRMGTIQPVYVLADAKKARLVHRRKTRIIAPDS